MTLTRRSRESNLSKKFRPWLRSRKYRKQRIAFYLLFLFAFGDIIPYALVPPPDSPPNGIHLAASQILDIRPTAHQPSSYTRHIVLFGNSSLAAYYLPVEQTIASYLQLHFHNTLVINRGDPGSNINGELLKLMDAPLTRGDIVIFYDG